MPPPDAELAALTPSQTRKALERLKHRPRRALGQNFLIDRNIVEKSLALGDIRAGDTVVEIGPGLGTLTRGLLARGACVHAVELDPGLCDWLEATLGGHPRAHLLPGDACAHPLAGLDPAAAPASAGGFKIIANLPYAISSTWMEAVLAGPALPERMVILVQKETADRMTAEPGSKAMGAIAIFLQGAYRREPGHAVPAACFYPVPKVDSTLFHLVRKPEPFRYGPASREAIRWLFTQRRKQVGSLARRMLPETVAAPWLDRFPACGARPTDRPEALPFHAWKALAGLIEE